MEIWLNEEKGDHFRYDIWPKRSCFGHLIPDIYLREFKTVKETPCGYWITEIFYGMYLDKKWVSKTSRKRFAYPTKEEAMESFLARKKKQREILKSQLEMVEAALSKATKENK